MEQKGEVVADSVAGAPAAELRQKVEKKLPL